MANPKRNVKTRKNTNTKRSKNKTPSSSLAKNKIIIVAAVLLFAVIGVMLMRGSQASTVHYVSFLPGGCSTTPALREGNRGPCVTALQHGLNNWTINSGAKNRGSGTIRVDGVFGPATKNKVIEFQKSKNTAGKRMPEDGVMGPHTWRAFLSDCNVFNTCNASKL